MQIGVLVHKIAGGVERNWKLEEKVVPYRIGKVLEQEDD